MTMVKWTILSSENLPALHAAIWESWLSETHRETFIPTKLDEVPTWDVLTEPANRLRQKVKFLLDPSPSARILTCGFRIPGAILESLSSHALAMDARSLGEARWIIAQPSRPEWAAIQAALRERLKSYNLTFAFGADVAAPVSAPAEWPDLLSYGFRPWLNKEAAATDQWLRILNKLREEGKISERLFTADQRAELLRPSLTWSSSGIYCNPMAYPLDHETAHRELVPDKASRHRLEDKSLRYRSLTGAFRIRMYEIENAYLNRPIAYQRARLKNGLLRLGRWVRLSLQRPLSGDAF